MGNNAQFKHILVDIDNYNVLKELEQTGDSFNNVIRRLLNKNHLSRQSDISNLSNESIINVNPDNKSFILRIDSGLHKVGVNSITSFKDHLEIKFLEENDVIVDYLND